MHATFCCLSSAADLEAILAHINLKSRRGKTHSRVTWESAVFPGPDHPSLSPAWERVKVTESAPSPTERGPPECLPSQTRLPALCCNQKHCVDNCHCHFKTDVFRVPSSTVFKRVPPHGHRDVKACTKAAIWHFLLGLEFALSLYCDMISLVQRQLWFPHCWSLSSGTGIHL